MGSQVRDYTVAASEAMLQQLAGRLRERNFEVLMVDGPTEARDAVLELIPAGSQVHTGKSKTLEDAGIFAALAQPGRFDFLRNRLQGMDRDAMRAAMRTMGATPDYMLGSAHAVTEDGELVFASATGSQLGPYASGANHVAFVIGSQKIVPDLAAAIERIRTCVQPYEDARMKEQGMPGTKLTRLLILEGEWLPGRTTVVLVREPIGR